MAHRDARLAGIDKEQPGQIDVLCVGNSLGICGVDPMELYRNFGYTAYNAGCEMQMPVETYFTIKKALETQDIKVIMWEANNLSKHHKNLDAYGSRLAEGMRYQFPFLRYHYVWKNRINGFIPRRYFKGFAVNEVIKPYTKGPYYDYSDEHTDVFAKEQYYYFDRIKRMCDEKGIKLVLYGVPSPVSYNIRMHRGLAKMAKEGGVDFLDGNAVLDVGGIGYNIRVTGETASRLSMTERDRPVRVYTYTYLREDQIALYGFLSRDELDLFRQLITVSGIGPKGGLALLSVHSADELRFAIASGDVKAISRAPGIGKRTAERVILDLKDKVGTPVPAAGVPEGNAGSDTAAALTGGAAEEAVEALTALGYQRSEAAAAVRKCADAGSTEEILRQALKYL